MQASSSAAAFLKVGAPGGPSIRNKATILQEIEDVLFGPNTNSSNDPLFEFLLVDSSAKSVWKKIVGPFGHACVRYRLPSTGEDLVMNIVGVEKAKHMVSFLPTAEYLFGTDFGDFGLKSGNEQGGVYNRQFWGLRLGPKLVTHGQIEALHAQYIALKKSHEIGARTFLLTGATFMNFIRQTSTILPIIGDIFFDPAEHLSIRGNCALWTSEGFVSAGILPNKRQFPKALWVDLYERYSRIDPSQVKVVEYREVDFTTSTAGKKKHSQQSKETLVVQQYVERFYKEYSTVPSIVHPFLPVKSFRFWNLAPLADAVVEVKVLESHTTKTSSVSATTLPVGFPTNITVAAVVQPGPKKRISVSFFWRHLLPLMAGGWLLMDHVGYTKSFALLRLFEWIPTSSLNWVMDAPMFRTALLILIWGLCK